MLKIALMGEARSGKDTLAGFFLEKGLTQFTFATGIKEIVDKYFPTASANGKPRRHLQVIGQQLRTLDEDVWVNYTLGKVNKFVRQFPVQASDGIIITDLRQPNEYRALVKEGFIIVRVDADKAVRVARMKEAGDIFSEKDLTHETEKYVMSLATDYIVDNNGTKKDLYIQFEEIWRDICYHN